MAVTLPLVDDNGARSSTGGQRIGPCAAEHPAREDGHMAIHITGDETADRVLAEDPFALLVGMLLEKQSA